MRLTVVAAVSALALVAGVALGYALGRDEDPAPRTESTVGLPAAAEETHAALLAAAESGDYEALRRLLPAKGGFEYSFGGPVEGGPIAYWQNLASGGPVIEILADILKMPYVLSRGIYVWPWTYTVESADDLSAHERALLAPLGRPSGLFVEGTGYLSWRAGIEPDGTWVFFVAGD